MGGPLRVLIVEDTENDALLVLRELQRSGYDPTSERVYTREAMIEALDSQEWDIVIADYVMPHFGGREALKLVQERNLDLPFIIVSGNIGEETAVAAMKAGAHDYVMKDSLARLGPAVERELLDAIHRQERRQAAEEIAHLNQVLHAIRAVNQLIVHEKNRDRLLQAACEALTSTRGYQSVWIALFDEDGSFAEGFEAGLGDRFPALCEVLERGELPACARGTLDKAGPCVVEDTAVACTDCPLSEDCSATAAMAMRLEHAGKVYGLVSVSLPADVANNQDEHSLLAEVTSDIAFALYAMETEAQRKQTEAEIRQANRLLQEALSELREAERQVVQQERLHALGQMASGIAHDFNNALTPILLLSDALLARPDNLKNTERVAEALQQIKTSATDAADVVRRLRSFYQQRTEYSQLQAIDLNEVIAEAISLTEPVWKQQAMAASTAITVATDLQPLPTLVGSEAELREALTNLILNSLDAMPDGGIITLRSRADDDTIVLEVSDTGTGMAPEVARRCLEPFFTTKEHHGTGIGLAMVYGTVQRHEGTVEIESALGEGTTVRIQLPVRVRQIQAPGAEVADTVLPPLDILLVEDDEVVCEALSQDLTDDGHRVATATNGAEGLEKFHAGSFDLVITDRAMPEMSGDQLAAAIKEAAPDMPVILLTGFGDMMDVTGEKPAGIDLILSKPVTVAALRKVLAKAMGK